MSDDVRREIVYREFADRRDDTGRFMAHSYRHAMSELHFATINIDWEAKPEMADHHQGSS